MKVCPTCNRLFQSGIVVCPKDGGLLNTLREWQSGDSVSGKFRIIEKIGHGSLGPAFSAQALPFGGTRVLKCLSVRLADDEDLINRFRQEILAASALRHLNAAHVEPLERSPDGRPFIVMEYVPGLSLRELLGRGGYIPALDVLDILGQVCAALDCAHRQGIIHRNLKPDNVIITEDHEGASRVKVMELGMANLRQAAAECGKQIGDVVITERAVVVGTMEYMSPEQAMGAPTPMVDGRSDLYSVGLMMFEALTGELPLAADDPTGLLFLHQGIAANESLCSMVLKALQKDPDHRFQSATEMIAALGEVSHSLGKPSSVKVKSGREAEAIRVSSSSQVVQRTFEGGHGQPTIATMRKTAEHAAPRIAERADKSRARPAPRAAAASIDVAFDEIRKSWTQRAGQVPVRRPAKSRLVRTSLLFICCTLGVFLASSVMYRNREFLMTLQEEGPTRVNTVASPGGAAHEAIPDPKSLEIQSSLAVPASDDQPPTVEEQDPYPPLPIASNDANARPTQRAVGGPSDQQKAQPATAVRADDRRSASRTEPSESTADVSRQDEIKKRIAVGWLLVERGNHRAAIESFAEALRLDPSNVEAQAALRLARFAVQNPNVDLLPSQSRGEENDSKKGKP